MTSPWMKKTLKLTSQLKCCQIEGFSWTRVNDFTMVEENFKIISSKMPPDGRIFKDKSEAYTMMEEIFEIHRSEMPPDRRIFMHAQD